MIEPRLYRTLFSLQSLLSTADCGRHADCRCALRILGERKRAQVEIREAEHSCADDGAQGDSMDDYEFSFCADIKDRLHVCFSRDDIADSADDDDSLRAECTISMEDIPLLANSNDRFMHGYGNHGSFQLYTADGSEAGTVSISLYFDYDNVCMPEREHTKVAKLNIFSQIQFSHVRIDEDNQV